MSDLTFFDYQDYPVRVIDRDGAPWFVAADVCRILELDTPRQAVTRLDDDERDLVNLNTITSRDGITTNWVQWHRITVTTSDGNPGNPNMTIVSESGLYTLIFSSRKEAAQMFRKWITAEVLPALRKYGRYAMPDPGAPHPPDGDHGGGYGDASLREREFWLRLIRETRLVWGEAAARAAWADSPLPDMIATPQAGAGPQNDDIYKFFESCVVCTGQAADRITAGYLARIYRAWRVQQGLVELSANAMGRAIAACAAHWVDPTTGQRCRRMKSDVMIYVGLRTRGAA